MTDSDKKDLAANMLKLLEDKDLECGEAIEIALNVFGFVATECGLSVHSAVSAVMDYYKQHSIVDEGIKRCDAYYGNNTKQSASAPASQPGAGIGDDTEKQTA